MPSRDIAYAERYKTDSVITDGAGECFFDRKRLDAYCQIITASAK